MISTQRFFLAAAAVLFLTPAFAQAPPTPAEAAMAASIDRNAEANVAFLRQLVEINSGTMNLPGVEAVAAILKPRLEALGFTVQTLDESQVGRAPHLISRHPCPAPNACGKRMLLIGHMDTVFDKASPFQHWTVSPDGKTAEGPGSNDMKGGLVILLAALQAMQDAGVLKQTDITAVLTGDEEAHGTPASLSRADMIDAAHHADVALEFEGTARQNGVYYGSISRRSASGWKLEVTGKTGHSSGIFNAQEGDGAIYELARILDEFRRTLLEKYLTYNVGTIAGGSRVEPGPDGALIVNGKSNIIPPTATAVGDMRTISDDQTTRTRARMTEIVAHHLPQTGATITFTEGYPAMAPTEASRAVLATLNQVNATLGYPTMPELDPLLRGAGDIAFVGFLPGLAGIGATGEGAHAPGETVDLPSQVINAKRDALLMYRLSQQK